jgi:predicted nucleic acid-binding Zn ribbon protein
MATNEDLARFEEMFEILARLWHLSPMPTYVYETIPQTTEQRPMRFEVKQSMKDKPLTHHPDTGVPVKRLISGGTGLMAAAATQSTAGGSCGTGCGCH